MATPGHKPRNGKCRQDKHTNRNCEPKTHGTILAEVSSLLVRCWHVALAIVDSSSEIVPQLCRTRPTAALRRADFTAFFIDCHSQKLH